MFTTLRKLFQKRNYSVSGQFNVLSGQPNFTTWTIQKAVKDGYKESGWVFRCVYLISKAVSSVPWGVYQDGELSPEHPITKLFRYPNPYISRQDIFELLTSWLELSGNAYLRKVKVGGRTVELWPYSPDRIAPIPSKQMDEWIKGYVVDQSRTISFMPEDIIHLKFIDPSNPLVGVGPLEVAGRAVDCDVAQQKFNKSTSDNRGLIDGVFTFKRQFDDIDEIDAISKKLEEKYKSKRGFAVLGDEAKYQRLGLSMAEMDFMNSRKFNRDEICIIFGVPLPLISSESMTYSNYQTSEEILWSLTIIPLLDDIRDTLNFSLQNELSDGQMINYDLSNISAVRRMLANRAATAKTYSDMGVPVEQINRIFNLGINEYEGWELSTPKATQPPQPSEGQRKFTLTPESRQEGWGTNAKLDRIASKELKPKFNRILKAQKADIFEALTKNKLTLDNADDIIGQTDDDFLEVIGDAYLSTAKSMGKSMVIESREIETPLEQQLRAYFEVEEIFLKELSGIKQTTIDGVLSAVKEGLKEGWSVKEYQQRLIDSGIFSPERALMLSRTIAGTAASIGQHESARMAGATHKKWLSNSGARKEHAERGSEPEVPIDGRFSPKFGAAVGPRYPLDTNLEPADRVNCRCSMTFHIRDTK